MQKFRDEILDIEKKQIENFGLLQSCYPEYETLISASTSHSNNIRIYIYEEKFLVDLDFNIIIESNIANSEIWVSSAVNDANRLWRFMEALTLDRQEYCYYVEEEGPDTFLYVQQVDKNNIRVFHISNRRQTKSAIEYNDVKVLQDFIINKREFIKCLYHELIRIISNSNKDEADEFNFGDFERLYKDSQIIKEYLREKKG